MSDPVSKYKLDRHAVRAHFERAARTYDDAAILQAEVAHRLSERLGVVKLSPAKVLDLGAGTGISTVDLLARYPRSQIVSLDLALNMLRKTARLGRWNRRPKLVVGDAEVLPFSDATFDLVFSNLMLQWCQPPDNALNEIGRILNPDGVVMFATLGPDTLHELRDSWAQVNTRQHVGMFMDMHDVGDAMLRAGLKDPVVDVETITMTYQTVDTLLKDLKALGATNALVGRGTGLGGRKAMADMMRAYETYRGNDGFLPASYEVIYGHAWGRKTLNSQSLKAKGEVHVPLSTLRRQNK